MHISSSNILPRQFLCTCVSACFSDDMVLILDINRHSLPSLEATPINGSLDVGQFRQELREGE